MWECVCVCLFVGVSVSVYKKLIVIPILDV